MKRAIAALTLFWAGPVIAQATGCRDYLKDTVTLSGQVVRRVYPGRPHYESVKRGDEPDTVFVLRLRQPLCVRASKDFAESVNQLEVQLYFTKADAPSIASLAGKPAILSGTLEGWVFGWHHLPILFRVRPPANGRRVGQARSNTALLLTGHDSEAASSLRSPAAFMIMPRSRTRFR